MSYGSRVYRWLCTRYAIVLSRQRSSARARRQSFRNANFGSGLQSLEPRVLLSATFELSDLLSRNGGDGTSGVVIRGIAAGDYSGQSVSSAGDINGDGFDDLVIGAASADPNGDISGETYVVFGKAGSYLAELELSTLLPANSGDGSDGFIIKGISERDLSGYSVSSAGDINGDGFDDLLIGAFGAPCGYGIGETYVIFGKANGFGSTLELSTLLEDYGGDGTDGFIINGEYDYDYAGGSVSSAGDVNGDGFDDLIIGATGVYPNQKAFAGRSYVVFGKSGNFTPNLNLSSLDSDSGFAIDGFEPGDFLGISVSSAGDINGDGFDDLLVGAVGADPSTSALEAGQSYVVFGKSGGFADNLDFSLLDGSNGFVLNGIDADDFSGNSVSSAGDINGDGFDDLLIGAPYGDVVIDEGESYVFFGKAGGFSAIFELSDLNLNNGANGFIVRGVDSYDQSGFSVSGVGDVNGDGLDDLLIGAPAADPNGDLSGRTFLVFGKTGGFPATLDLSSLLPSHDGDGSAGIVINGIDAGDQSGISVSMAGDVDGDGFDDLLIGADRAASTGANYVGETYLLFGSDSTGAVTQLGNATANTLDGTAAPDVLIGGQGDDTLVGNGGADVLRGGQGDDLLAISDTSFQRLVGGNGTDTLRLDTSGLTFDLSTIPDNKLTGIERIDITGLSPNTLVLNFQEVINLSDESNALVVIGDGDDTVKVGSGWTASGQQQIEGKTFDYFVQGAASVAVSVEVNVVMPAEVVDRHIFYNNSGFDDPADGFGDDDAIAPSPGDVDDVLLGKTALLPGETATFANYTSYSLGINGIMIDIRDLPNPNGLLASDFEFLVGNNNDLTSWIPAPDPSDDPIVRFGSGVDGSDRITIVWPDHDIQGQWLQVTVKANANTGLVQEDIFYFGNAPGETGDKFFDTDVSNQDAIVDVFDVSGLRSNATTDREAEGIDNRFDHDRNGRVNVFDLITVLDNRTDSTSALSLITVPEMVVMSVSSPNIDSVISLSPVATFSLLIASDTVQDPEVFGSSGGEVSPLVRVGRQMVLASSWQNPPSYLSRISDRDGRFINNNADNALQLSADLLGMLPEALL